METHVLKFQKGKFKFDLCVHVFNRKQHNLVFKNQVLPEYYASLQCQSKAVSCTRKIAVGFRQVETRRARKDSKIARIDVSISIFLPFALNTYKFLFTFSLIISLNLLFFTV